VSSCSGTVSDAGTLPRVSNPHCNGAEETAEHLVFQYPACDQTWGETWPDQRLSMDPRRLQSFLGSIGAVVQPPPQPGMRERQRIHDHFCRFKSV